MYYTSRYQSPLGLLTMASLEGALAGLWIEGQKYFEASMSGDSMEKPELPVFEAVGRWLDRYFAGSRPDPKELPLNPLGSEFRMAVWKLLLELPYGQVTTYGTLAKRLEERGGGRVSAQAVGGAVGHNPISIIVPCHRVVGADGSLTGYAGGIDKKVYLLRHEGVDMSGLYVPRRGTAL